MNIKMIGAAVLAGAMAAGCCEKACEEEIAVSVNGVTMSKSVLDAQIEKVIAAQGDRIPASDMEFARQQIGNEIVQSFIVENALLAKAQAAGIVVTDADRKEREDEFAKISAKMPEGPKSLEEAFAKDPMGVEHARKQFSNLILIDKFVKGEQAKQVKGDNTAKAKEIVDGIVSNNLESAKSVAAAEKSIKLIKQELDKVPADQLFAKFAEIAKAKSDCPSKERGGDLDEFTHGAMVKEFDEAAFKLPVGKVSDPVKTDFGYHLILVTKKIPAVEAKGDTPASPEKVRASHILIKTSPVQEVPSVEQVKGYLDQRDSQAFIRTFVMDSIKEAKIEAAEAYQHLLPSAEEGDAPAGAVETPAEK